MVRKACKALLQLISPAPDEPPRPEPRVADSPEEVEILKYACSTLLNCVTAQIRGDGEGRESFRPKNAMIILRYLSHQNGSYERLVRAASRRREQHWVLDVTRPLLKVISASIMDAQPEEHRLASCKEIMKLAAFCRDYPPTHDLASSIILHWYLHDPATR